MSTLVVNGSIDDLMKHLRGRACRLVSYDPPFLHIQCVRFLCLAEPGVVAQDLAAHHVQGS